MRTALALQQIQGRLPSDAGTRVEHERNVLLDVEVESGPGDPDQSLGEELVRGERHGVDSCPRTHGEDDVELSGAQLPVQSRAEFDGQDDFEVPKLPPQL